MKLIKKAAKRLYQVPIIKHIYIALFNAFSIKKIKKINTLKLHLGCGSVKLDGFINIDIENWAGKCDLIMDCVKLKKIKSKSVDYIFTHALLEHIPPYKTSDTLIAWNRVLKIGGIILIEVPDLERIFEDWLVKGILSEKEAINNIFGGNKKEKDKYSAQDHLTGFTYTRLCNFLKECGFNNFKRIEHDIYHHILCIQAMKVKDVGKN
ncbi:MAG: hypothetical protein SVZ03_09815 [Spirochaetota bacterium]|nr:hypothetical protein [Spirochaetota bacterium]